ncbi:hypothetical protein CEG14_04820 [Bordetella genomosp. 1]|uniref:Phosphonate metabolism protein n=1 Tax=Bordetella genomosp. 1 TaxID=1395607 RepID=A0A261SW30_9BORD|nr:DUF1045 domain-containing protein [Bordetella genomosp. 1]OZI41070.1 hypothetical protein CEG14_04820 [Bordetella genomosp. 1]
MAHAPAHRYAVYLAPEGAWWDQGSRWLGRCADTGAALASEAPAAWTAAPRLYGLHATLKAPLRLAEGSDAAVLDQALRSLAARHRPFALRLALRQLRGFLAWCIADDDTDGRRAIQALADDAVRALDPLRAPATEAELARRRPERLPEPERAMLAQWGYPYAFDTFRFHITLTGMLEDTALAAAADALARLSAPLCAQPMPAGAVSLYVQPEPGADFLVARHYGFDGTTHDGAGARFLPAMVAT